MTTVRSATRLGACALLSFIPALLLAQPPARVRPVLRCPAYDSLMVGVRRSDPGAAQGQAIGGNRFFNGGGAESMSDRDRGIRGVGLSLRGRTGVRIDSATFQVNVQTIEQEERPLEERQGVLILDDSVSIDIGSFSQTPGATFPNGVKSWYLYAPTPPGTILRAVRAERIDIKVGTTRWSFPTSYLRDLRGMVAAYVCAD
jgi:hypothetical protein